MINRTEEEIMHGWDIRAQPIVSICSATYNHENFISEAIDSFLMQKTDFPFEIIIRDDCSTDKTAEIIQQYTDKYPNIIKPIYERENQYVKGQRPLPIMHKKAIGKYIAMCEGDDYWIDPLKLQKQVDFLETHKSYSISYHDANVIDIKGEIISKSYGPKIRDFSTDEMLSGDAIILTGTAMFRNVGLSIYPKIFDTVVNGDMARWHMLGLHGSGKFQKNIDNSCYRIHSGGVWSSIGDRIRMIYTTETLSLMKKNLPENKHYLEERISQKIQQFHTIILYRLLRKRKIFGYMQHLVYILFHHEVDVKWMFKLHYRKIIRFLHPEQH